MTEYPYETWQSPASRFSIRYFRSIDSTNRYLLDEARVGAPDGLVSVTDFQEKGRGRLGREWVAPKGSSLLVSILMRPQLWWEQPWQFSAAVAVAACRALASETGVEALLKWPNDLVVDDRKLGGMLSETIVNLEGVTEAVVVGLGCNLWWQYFPPEIAETATACSLITGQRPDRRALLFAMLNELARLTPGKVLTEYRARLSTLGKQITVDLSDRRITGTALELQDDGRLLIATQDGSRVVSAGDVVHLR